MAARKLEVQILGDAKSLERAFGKASKASDSFGAKVGGGLLNTAKVATVAAGAIGSLAVVMGVKAVNAAVDLGEQISKNQVVFGKAGKDVVKWSETLASSFGISQNAALEAAGTFGNMLVPMGFTRVEAANVSQKMVQLASDMASFNNASPAETLEAIRAGLAGESEPLRRFGVFLNDARLKTKALEIGLYEGKGALDAHAKAAATTALIYEDMQKSGSVGDFARTSDSLANKQRILRAELENASASIGRALLPAATKAVAVLAEVIPHVARFGEKTAEWLGPKLEATVGFFRRHWDTIKAVAVGAGKVLGAVVDAIGVAFKWVAQQADRYWPVVRKAAEDVARWYQTNLKPAIQNVLAAISAFWDRFGGTITRVAKTWFNSVLTIVHTVMNNIKGVINIVLAVIRGDWGKAWDELKGIVSRTIGAAVQVVRNAAGMYLEAAKAIGKAIVDGIVQGASGIASALGKKLKDGIGGALNAVKSGFGIFSPSKVTEEEIGVPLGEGVVVGAVGGLDDLASRMTEKVKDAIDRARERVEASKSSFTNAWSTFASDALTAFDATTTTMLGKVEAKLAARVASIERALGRRLSVIAGARGNQTDSERELDALRGVRDADRRRREMEDAQAALASANAGGDEKAIREAQQRVRDLELDELERTLSEKAARERQALDDRMRREEEEATRRAEVLRVAAEKAAAAEQLELTARQALRRRHFEVRLAALGEEAQKEGAKQGAIQTQITNLLRTYGVNYKGAGKALGQAFAEGLAETEAAVRSAAESLRAAAASAIGAAQVAVKVTAKTPEKRAAGGPVMAGRPYIVGEVGPELFVPGSSGAIIPNGAGGNIVVNVHGSVVTERDLIDAIHSGLLQKQRRNVSLGIA